MILKGEMEPYRPGPQHGPKIANLEAKLGPSWPQDRILEAKLRPSWPQDRILEAKLDPSWLQDRPWGGQVGSKLAPRGDFWRSARAS